MEREREPSSTSSHDGTASRASFDISSLFDISRQRTPAGRQRRITMYNTHTWTNYQTQVVAPSRRGSEQSPFQCRQRRRRSTWTSRSASTLRKEMSLSLDQSAICVEGRRRGRTHVDDLALFPVVVDDRHRSLDESACRYRTAVRVSLRRSEVRSPLLYSPQGEGTVQQRACLTGTPFPETYGSAS